MFGNKHVNANKEEEKGGPWDVNVATWRDPGSEKNDGRNLQ